MTGRYLPLALRMLTLGQPAPVDLWNDRGVLLLARGQVVPSDTFLRSLAAHRPMIREADYIRWLETAPEGQDLVRPGAAPGFVRPRAAVPAATPSALDLLTLTVPGPGADLDPIDLTQRLSKTLAALLRDGPARPDFLERLSAVAQVSERLLVHNTDDVLFMLIQMLQDAEQVYCANHALLSDVICRLAHSHLVSELDVPIESLANAALTMNIGMFALHNELRTQRTPPDELQRRQINEHPRVGTEVLRQIGVNDDIWLRLVLQHHESFDGKGYPEGLRVDSLGHELLQLADRFAAAVTPRLYRKALAPLVALRNVYSHATDRTKALGEMLVRCLGLYPPGSYVRLVNQETAVVVRRGHSAKQPWVVSITNSQNIALAIPVLRDTRQPEFAVVAPVPPDAVRVRLDPARILKRV